MRPLSPNLRWWDKAAEEKSSVMEARIMCLGSDRNRCWSQANGSVPALSKTRLLDVWRFTVCSLWMGVNLECILYLIRHQGETDCPSHFSFQSYHSSRAWKKEKILPPDVWATKLGTELPNPKQDGKKKPTRFSLQGDAVWASGGHTIILPAAIK